MGVLTQPIRDFISHVLGDITLRTHSDSMRIIFVLWTLISFVMAIAFAQSMTAMMTIPTVKVVDTAQGIVDTPGMGIIMEKGTAYTQALSVS